MQFFILNLQMRWSIFVRAKLDRNARLLDFTDKLEKACVGAVESGKMTKDLALLIHGPKYGMTSIDSFISFGLLLLGLFRTKKILGLTFV